VPIAIGRLAALEYRHQGNLGVEDRETFESPAFLPRHSCISVRLPRGAALIWRFATTCGRMPMRRERMVN
jgi:hypothetical protein